MTRLVFWDVDTLYDFMHADGKLYVRGSEEIIPALKALTDFAHGQRIPIVASADNHTAADAEISDAPDWVTTFPPHCMAGTPGQLKIAETALRDPLVIEPELQDPGALAHRILAHRGDFSSTSGRSTCSPTRTSRPCSGRSSPRQSWSMGWPPISATSTRSRD